MSEPLNALYRRNYRAVQLDGGRVFVAGGYDELNAYLEPAIYDAIGNKWARIRAPSFCTRGDAAFLESHGVVMAGGAFSQYDHIDQCELDDARRAMVEIYSATEDAWNPVGPCFDFPPIASTGIVAVDLDTFVLYGASFPENIDDPNCVVACNISQGVWQVSPKAPFCTSQRGSTDVCILSRDDVLFNGRHIYNLKANAWETLSNPLFRVSYKQYHRVGNLLYCWGMSDNLVDGRIQVLDLENRHIVSTSTVKGAIGRSVVDLHDGSMLIFGGFFRQRTWGDRDGKAGFLERVLHVGVGAQFVHEVGRLSEAQALGSAVSLDDNKGAILSADCTRNWLLSFDGNSFTILERSPSAISPVGHFDWMSSWLARCESPAEQQFLVAAVAEFRLSPSGSKLIGECVLELQKEIGTARADFLFNGLHLVEIDGREFHSGRDEAIKDADRDSRIRRQGYRILRIPAYRIFHAPAAAMADVRDALG